MIHRIKFFCFMAAVSVLSLASSQSEAAQDLVFGRDAGTPGTVDLLHIDLGLAVPSAGASGVTGLMSTVSGGSLAIGRIDTMVATSDGNIAVGLGDTTDNSAIYRIDVAQALATFGTGDTLLGNFGLGRVTEALVALDSNALAYGNTFGGGLLGHFDAANNPKQLLGGLGSFVNIVETTPGNIVLATNITGTGVGRVRHTDLSLALPAGSGSGVGTTIKLSNFITIFDVAAGENGAAYSTDSGQNGRVIEYTPGALTLEIVTTGLAQNGVPMSPLEGLANGNVTFASEAGGFTGSLLTYDPLTNAQVAGQNKFGTGVVTQLIELPDGNVVYARTNINGQPPADSILNYLDTTTGVLTHLLQEPGSSIEELIALDDGNFVFTSDLAGGNLSHYDIGTLTRTTLLTGQGDVQGLVAVPTLSNVNADFDGDSDIDGADFLAWQKGFGIGSTLQEGDADGNGVVDADDLAVWESQYGTTVSPVAAIAAVPEPGTLLLIGLGGMFSLATRRRSMQKYLRSYAS